MWHTETQTFTRTNHSKLPGAARFGGARRDSQPLSRHETHNLQDFKAKADSTFPGVEKAADSTFTGVEKAVNESAAIETWKAQRRLITPSVVFIKAKDFRSQDFVLHNITVSCIVTLLLAQTFYSIACSAFGVCSVANIHLMLSLHHFRCRDDIHRAASRPFMARHHSRRLVTPSWCRLRYKARSQTPCQ